MMHRRNGSMGYLAGITLLLSSLILVPAAFATNGMNLEGYGPIATGMGGASMAYDNGTAAMMNNPATLSLMDAKARLDVALGFLGPNIEASTPGMPSAKSSADMFIMPAFGYVRKSDQLTYGMGVFAQGGMGTEYSASSFLAAGSNEKVRSEVSVGRFLVPVSYKVNDKLNVGGTVDFVWAGMDLKMALNGQQFGDMVPGFPGATQRSGVVGGTMISTFGAFFAGGGLDPGAPVNYGRFDFSDDSDFSGKAKGTGLGAKIGATYKVNDRLTIGGAYHSTTSLSDLEASGANVTIDANVDDNVLNGTFDPIGGVGTPAGTYTQTKIPVNGKIKVKDFQWPQMLAFGMAHQTTPKLLLVADYKWINWADVMKDFKMTFTADANQAGLAQAFANTVLDATMFQKWKDQHVFMLGAAYKFTNEFTGRAGVNIANNPIPDTYMNPLFPAIEENHIMLGAGYDISKSSSVDASITYAPEVKATTLVHVPGGGLVPVTVKHSQNNAQIMYSYRF